MKTTEKIIKWTRRGHWPRMGTHRVHAMHVPEVFLSNRFWMFVAITAFLVLLVLLTILAAIAG
ncbi:MAG: hypothetical protein ACYST9_01370, partial [Planctomycetota bacterium]